MAVVCGYPVQSLLRTSTQPKRRRARSHYIAVIEMPYEADEILAELGYALVKTRLSNPCTNRQLERLAELRQRIDESLPLVSLSSETARRETLVAPTLLEVARYCQCQMPKLESVEKKNSIHRFFD